MTSTPFRPVDRWLRALAYDVLCLRDRLFGWKRYQKSFMEDHMLDSESFGRKVEAALRGVLSHAYETSPYYNELWRTMDFHPSSPLIQDELEKLPFLTKDIIKEKKDLLVSSRFRKSSLDISYTGGTTGTQTSFYLDHVCTVSRVGRQWGMLDHCGYRPGMRRALVWGVHDDLPAQGAKGSFTQWFRRYASSLETLACSVMSETAMLDYHGRLQRFRPEVMYGYPSALVQLGRFIEERGLEPIRVRKIFTTAERLGGAIRKQLNRLYGGEVFNLYCTREYGCIGFECRTHQGFHVDTGSVFLEIVKDGRRVEPGESGEIVITDLLNYGMPFIRSRTGDMGMLSSQPCECGSRLPLLKNLDGRSSDLIYRPDGSVVPSLMLTDLFMDLPSVRYLQFVQERVNQLDVVLVVTKEFSEEVQAEVVREVRQLMGDDIAIQVKLVDEIARNPRSGKLPEVISKVDAGELALLRGTGPGPVRLVSSVEK
jgi:phenylacetate-CoA ligase